MNVKLFSAAIAIATATLLPVGAMANDRCVVKLEAAGGFEWLVHTATPPTCEVAHALARASNLRHGAGQRPVTATVWRIEGEWPHFGRDFVILTPKNTG